MDKKLSVSLENSLVPMKAVSLVSGDIIAKVRTLRLRSGQATKNPINPEAEQARYGAGKTEIEQSLARFQSMLRRQDSNLRSGVWAARVAKQHARNTR